MSVPTHNLYDFIYQVTEKRFWLKYFYPWGHKDIANLVDYYSQIGHVNDLRKLGNTLQNTTVRSIFRTHYTHFNWKNYQPFLVCHDQEPLNYSLYCDQLINKELLKKNLNEHKNNFPNYNLRHTDPVQFQKRWLLLHSELNSREEKLYNESGMFVCAYWWSHAMISRDWFRFAKYDTSLHDNNTSEKRFLIYCRETSGSRQYRKKFLKQINTINNSCQFQSFSYNNISSDSSAIYVSEDYCKTDISVILETVFDERIHLTEKTCRAIACGHPFVLAAGPGSLNYLRTYGFKTFSPWIDESYDCELDTNKRLKMIAAEIKRLESLSDSEFKKIKENCKRIALYNKNLFFSDTFENQLVKELKNNVSDAYDKIKNDQLDWKKIRKDYLYDKKYRKEVFYSNSESDKIKRHGTLSLILHLKKGGTLEDYVPPDLA